MSRYRGMSDTSLRALLVVYGRLDIFPTQRDAIRVELAARAMVAWVEARLHTTIGWCRGGKS